MRIGVRHELSPRVVDLARSALRPGWTRSVIVRRSASVALVCAAIVVAIAGHRGHQERAAIVAAHDITPGHTLSAADLSVREVAGGALPDGALRMIADGIGHTAAGRIRAGEILTDTRLLSSRLPSALTGHADARLVPVRLADETVASVLREGDVVDVLTAADDSDSIAAAVLARGAVVALTATADTGMLATSHAPRSPVLLAMDESAAHRVARAGLDASLAVVVH